VPKPTTEAKTERAAKREAGAGRPTKKERREIDALRHRDT
jgi:hypothetical protein